MRSMGIVAEYNPFHNGHQFQLNQAKELSQSDVTIAIMSGNFLQRGEPALVSKWARTQMAIKGGVDLVFELPYAFSVHKAETFAYGAIYILNAMGCKNVCFGSESGEIDQFYTTLQFIKENQQRYDEYIHSFMKEGMSYPASLSASFKKLNPDIHTVDLSKPNNILGYHYILAASRINPQIIFNTVQRKGATHHDKSFTDEKIASATSIRESLFNEGQLKNIKPYVPETTMSLLNEYIQNFGQIHKWEQYWPYLQYKLLTMSNVELKEIYEVEEGLENRLLKAAPIADSFLSFMESIKTKRYTWTRLQRICVHILTNTKKETVQGLKDHPTYARLLGMNEHGRNYLNKIKKDVNIPILANASAFKDEMLTMDLKAANIYAQVLKEPHRTKLLKMEFNQPPIYFRE
ncbi:nucleotidyltransferase [Pseudogracilibacillus auburnensis]|uniref:nucleotidyltransferase n=1 Tax=Pseudogracilibacillus auburnensis TaxID=1494959 RepID=UPI001A95BDEA|nr:nucleotidyltransferase [Pseudogracilibacillus auburnensis]MBO1004918.1 nucleotidyltransferase [Pseudogracilibacillus auburnensis]